MKPMTELQIVSSYSAKDKLLQKPLTPNSVMHIMTSLEKLVKFLIKHPDKANQFSVSRTKLYLALRRLSMIKRDLRPLNTKHTKERESKLKGKLLVAPLVISLPFQFWICFYLVNLTSSR